MDRERLRQCLESLTELQRESITLVYYGGYTYRAVTGPHPAAAWPARSLQAQGGDAQPAQDA